MLRRFLTIAFLWPMLAHGQIVNGDFSVGSLGCSNIAGWTFSAGSASPEITFAFTGANTWLDLTPCGAFGNGSWIEQDVPTIPGQCYQLNFELGSVCGWDGSDAGVYITIDGIELGGRIFNDSMLCVVDAINFMPFTSPIFQATSTSTTIRFRGEGRCTDLSVAIGGGCSSVGQLANPGVIGIDNISIEPVTSEASWNNPLPAEINLCAGADTTLNASIGSPTATYIWSNGAQGSSISVSDAGYYEVLIEDGCISATYGTTITTQPLPNLDLGPDIAGCFPNGVIVGDGYSNIIWQDGVFPSPRLVNTNGLYVGQIANACGQIMDSITVVLDSLLLTDQFIEASGCKGYSEPIELNLESPYSWIWPDGTSGISYMFSESQSFEMPIFSPCGTVEYHIVLTTEPCFASLYVPNSFTPDADGLNDVWQPIAHAMEITHCAVFNRWGEKVFESSDPNPTWTGDFGGGAYFVPDQIYTYQITYLNTNGKSEVTTGHITLIR